MDEPRRPAGPDGPRDTGGESRRGKDPAGGLPLFARHLRIESLTEKLDELAAGCEHGGFATRREVATGVVLPLLRHLGWDIGDATVVTPHYETPAGVVDFALCHPPGEPRILLGIGALPGPSVAPGDHPFEDCSTRAVQLAVTEDGRSWRFHFPAGRGSIHNRQFARFDIVDDARKDGAEILDTYLAFHAVKSGAAFRESERNYGEVRFPAEAHGAWHRALKGREVRRRFLRELEEAAGVPADRDRAQRFIVGQIGSVDWPADPPDPEPARRVEVGDRVFVHDFETREIVTRVVVGSDPDWDKGEVSRDSDFGHALLGAREGEVREVRLQGGMARRMRIVLIADG